MHKAASLLRETRVRAGLTQSELAKRAGVTQPVISRAEASGANPRIATLDRLLRAAGARLELAAPEVRLPDVDEDPAPRAPALDPGRAARGLRHVAAQPQRPTSPCPTPRRRLTSTRCGSSVRSSNAGLTSS